MICRKWPISAIRNHEKLYSFLEKLQSFSSDRDWQKVAHFCNVRSREIVQFVLRNCKVFLEIVIFRKWPNSGICDLVRDSVFCDRDRVIVDRELQGPYLLRLTIRYETLTVLFVYSNALSLQMSLPKL